MKEKDLEIDSVLDKVKKKKSIKSGKKGGRGERIICKSLNERFACLLQKHKDWGGFNRSVGSGNRWGQGVHLSQAAKQTFSGDISCPTNFKFVIESKSGYNDIDLNSIFDGGQKELDKFFCQVLDDASRSGRKPLLIWRKDRKPTIAFVLSEEINIEEYQFSIRYKNWVGVNLDNLLKLDDAFFFNL